VKKNAGREGVKEPAIVRRGRIVSTGRRISLPTSRRSSS